MIHAIKGDYSLACWLIVAGAVCDSLDGRVARMAKATSSFGVQYDSLSDLTSFGIAPAILLFCYTLNSLDRFGISVTAFYSVCAALRLARFNVSAEEKTPPSPAMKKCRKGYFQGLPSPASAGLVVTSLLIQVEFNLFSEPVMKVWITALTIILAGLMVSNVPFPSFKEVNWRAKGKVWILLIPVMMILAVIQAPEITLFSIGYLYLLLSMGWAAYLFFVKDKNQGVNGVA